MSQNSSSDLLHFPRTNLAKTLINNLREGISHAFTLFAPRRMGKTHFLLKDVKPCAEELGFNVFYFSFMDEDQVSQNIISAFTYDLLEFHQSISPLSFLDKIKRLDVFGVSVEKGDQESPAIRISQVINDIAKNSNPTLLLLDEVQELAHLKNSQGLVRSLRTGLDVNKDKVKVIFTGSSTNGLRMLFNDSKAPFFHFSHAIDFPLLGQEFSDFMADIYEKRTRRSLDREDFFCVFRQLNYTPLYLRNITRDLIINPNLSLDEVVRTELDKLHSQSGFDRLWQELNLLEKQLVLMVNQGRQNFYREDIKCEISAALGEDVKNSAIQYAFKRLSTKEILSKSTNDRWLVNNPLFAQWIREKVVYTDK